MVRRFSGTYIVIAVLFCIIMLQRACSFKKTEPGEYIKTDTIYKITKDTIVVIRSRIVKDRKRFRFSRGPCRYSCLAVDSSPYRIVGRSLQRPFRRRIDSRSTIRS